MENKQEIIINNGYVFAKDNKRIFINTSLGCVGGCTYCYLPKVGYSNNSEDSKTIPAEKIIEYIENSKLTINEETLITLGCYSECWDEKNKKETIKLIKYFLQRGNQIQLSTKRQMTKEEIGEILPFIKYFGQFIIFVSSATISKQQYYEKNTTPVLDRFHNFILCNTVNIPIVLYIKPVLENITIKDIDLYKKYIMEYKINDVVVGSIFTTNVLEETVHFSNKNELFYTKISEEDEIILELSKVANVYRRSSEVMHKYFKNNFIKKKIRRIKNES